MVSKLDFAFSRVVFLASSSAKNPVSKFEDLRWVQLKNEPITSNDIF
jgi:hypothetical protein